MNAFNQDIAMAAEGALLSQAELSERIHASVAAGALVTAQQDMRAWEERFGEDFPFAQMAVALHRAAGEGALALAAAERAVDRWPDMYKAHVMVLRAALEIEDKPRAADHARAAVARFPTDIKLLDLSFHALVGPAPQEALEVAGRMVSLGHALPVNLARQGHIMLRSMEGAEALRYFRAAIDAGAPEASLLADMAFAAEYAGLLPLARSYWEQVEAHAAESGFTGNVHTRLEKIAQLSEDERNRDRVEAYTVEQLMVAGGGGAPFMFRTAAEDLIGYRVPGSREAILEFGVIASMMGIARPLLTEKHRSLGVNIIMFSDPRRLIMMGGAVSLGETYDDTIAVLKQMMAQWGVERIYVRGRSAGAYPAIRYGLDLGAPRIFLQAPAVTPAGSDSPLVPRLLAALGPNAIDVRAAIEAKRGASEIIISYNLDRPMDVSQVDYLRDLPNVRLLPFADHDEHRSGSSKGVSPFDVLLLGK